MTEPDGSPPEAEHTPMHVLQSRVPLSESIVWRLQRTFYGDQGIEAWSPGRVPQSVTTSPIIARAYARVVLGFWRDFQSSLEPSQPVYIVELGAGSGRFGYRFLKAFTPLMEEWRPSPQRFVYVMTDAAPTVIDYWRDNERLRSFVESGALDFAHFDLLHPAPLTLLNSGAVVAPSEVANPIVLIGNYIFDSIPQDAFTVTKGQLFQNLVSVSASTPDLDLTAPDSKVRIGINFESDTVATDTTGPGDPYLDQVLRGYRARLDETTVVIPRFAMATVRYFHELAAGRLLCLIGDFGDTREENLQRRGPPGFGAGGAFWLAVNFHALGEYARALGGRARHPLSHYAILNISMLLFGLSDDRRSETDLAYAEAIEQRGPDDLFVLTGALVKHLGTLSIEALLAALRTTGWDSDYLGRCVPFLIERLDEADEHDRQALLSGLGVAWEQYYPIRGGDDLPFAIGAVLYSLERYTEALSFFERSLRDFGEDPRTTLNLALTHYRLEHLGEALTWLDRTLLLDPSNELAQSMRPDVAAELAGR
jgi:tetratricopeptide (TPR) repeat protein